MNDWHYDLTSDLDQPLLERLRRFPREPDMLNYGVRSVSAVVLRAWLGLYHRLRIIGSENLPNDRSCILVANHASHLDALCLLSAIPLRRLHQAFPAAAADYFFVSVPRIALSVLVVNALPFHRETHTRESLAVCRQLLAGRGNILIVFPEGTRSADGEISSFKPGVGMLVAGSDVPVVPCYVSGTHRAMPKGNWLPRPHRITLTLGRPRFYPGQSRSKEAGQRICADLREAVIALSTGAAAPVFNGREEMGIGEPVI